MAMLIRSARPRGQTLPVGKLEEPYASVVRCHYSAVLLFRGYIVIKT